MPKALHSSFSPLKQWLQKVLPPYPKPLAWCHTTDAYTLRTIIKTGKIAPQHCIIFNEDVVYFFYGRPAFRRGAFETIGQHARAPVVILLNQNLITQGVRLFPFDSGAFSDNRYAKWMHDEMAIGDFELGCENNAPLRHISAFFSTNQGYFDLACTLPDISYSGEFEVESILKLLMDQDTDKADDRKLAMELQIRDEISFDSSSVLTIILPDELLQASWFDEFIKGPGKGIEICDYKLALQRQAIQYQDTLESKAANIQELMGLL